MGAASAPLSGRTFTYDADLDFLTRADHYPDGAFSAWSYDDAGSRTDASCDALNRATNVSGTACTNDILGNRLTKGTSASYTWGVLKRMSGLETATQIWSSAYRADGLRVRKAEGALAEPPGGGMNRLDGIGDPPPEEEEAGVTYYRYDGQMPFEDDADGSYTRYALGARGVDSITTSSAVCYPIYDCHGNMVTTLSRSGLGYTYAPKRGYDPWGVIRIGSTTGNPAGRYCASLGHIPRYARTSTPFAKLTDLPLALRSKGRDDESGLVYMRARYYEPSSGRFVCEDPKHQGANWAVYCNNEPVDRGDRSGRSWCYFGRDDFPYLDLSTGDWWDPVYWFDWGAFVTNFNVSITVQLVCSSVDLAGLCGVSVPGATWLGPILNLSNLVTAIPLGPLSLGMQLEYMWQFRIAMWGLFMEADCWPEAGGSW